MHCVRMLSLHLSIPLLSWCDICSRETVLLILRHLEASYMLSKGCNKLRSHHGSSSSVNVSS